MSALDTDRFRDLLLDHRKQVTDAIEYLHKENPGSITDAATRGTYNLITTATDASRFILLSSLRPFERYPADWWVTESWAPRPTTDVADLAPYLAELTVREQISPERLEAIPWTRLCIDCKRLEER